MSSVVYCFRQYSFLQCSIFITISFWELYLRKFFYCKNIFLFLWYHVISDPFITRFTFKFNPVPSLTFVICTFLNVNNHMKFDSCIREHVCLLWYAIMVVLLVGHCHVVMHRQVHVRVDGWPVSVLDLWTCNMVLICFYVGVRGANLPKAEIWKIVVKYRYLCVKRGKNLTNIFWGWFNYQLLINCNRCT